MVGSPLACALALRAEARWCLGSYRDMARMLGFEGHIAWADEMA